MKEFIARSSWRNIIKSEGAVHIMTVIATAVFGMRLNVPNVHCLASFESNMTSSRIIRLRKQVLHLIKVLSLYDYGSGKTIQI